jgi:predicted RNA binding protein YcfA (HicA-like mRNA interferase family)
VKITNKDLRRLIRDARRRGWHATLTNGGHIRLTHPNGGLVHTSYTPSDHRSIRNLDAQLRRAERRAS